MGLRTWLAEKLIGKMTPEQWFADFGVGEASKTGINVTALRAMQASAVMSCVSILSEDLAKLPVHVYRRMPDGGKQIVKNHALERLFIQPNWYQTRFEFIEMMQAALVLRSNAYAVILRDGRGRPWALIPWHPDRVTLMSSPDGSLFYWVTRSTPFEHAALASEPLMIPAEDMLHVRWLSMDGLVGLSRIGMAREAIGLTLAQQDHASQLAGNGARPGGMLTTEKVLGEDVVKRLKQQWTDNFAGENKGKTAVLEQGLKWEALGMTSVDAQFIESRRFQAEEIARLFRVPPHKIGIQEGRTNSSVVQADQDYMNNTIASYAERWEAKLESAFGLDGDELFAEFDLEHFLRADIGTRYNAYRVGVVGMFLTPNEVRSKEGLGRVEGGDTLYQPTNVAPIGFEPSGSSDSGPGSDITGAPAAGGDGDPAAPKE